MIPREQAHLEVHAITHEGMSGKNNEDRYGVSAYTVSEQNPTASVFAIVADGIGGHQAGEIAAEMVVESISHAVASSEASNPVEIMEQAIIRAGQEVNDQSTHNAAQQGMGSTCVCAWVLGDQLYIASVGDSRIYLLRDNEIQQLTTDHTWAQEAVEHGILTPDQVRGHPQSHIIRRYLGSKTAVEVDFRLRLYPDEEDEDALANQGMQLRPGDKLLLCSDGLTDLVEDGEIKEILQWTDQDVALQELVDLANQRGGHDNITIVTLEMPSQGEAKKKSRSGLYWLVGIIIGMIVVVALVALAYLSWQYIQPEPTATLPQPTTSPAVIETEESQSEQPQATITPEPLPTETPVQSTVTIWPTSTDSP